MKKLTSKEILVETALELAKYTSVDKITVKSIVENSGLSLQTFYNHFSDKYALFFWIHERQYELLLKKLENGNYSIHDFLMDYTNFFMVHNEFIINALTNTHGYDSFLRNITEKSFKAMSAYLAQKNKIKKLPDNVLISLKIYIYGTTLIYNDWITSYNSLSPETFASILEQSIPECIHQYLK